MANEQNLRPGEHKFTQEEAKKGGRASGKARRDRASLKKCLEVLLESEIPDKQGNMLSGAEALSAKIFQAALKGDMRAWELLRDTAGQKPVEKVQNTAKIVDLSDKTTKEIREMLDDEV